MNSNLSIIFCLSVTWKEVEVSYGVCLVEVKRHVQNVQPSVSERKMESGSKKMCFSIQLNYVNSFLCNAL